MTPRLSGHSFYILPCGLVFFVLKRLLRIARQWSREKFAVLFLKPRSPVRIFYVERGLLMQVWLCPMLLILEVLCFFFFSKCSQKSCFLRQFKYIFYFLSLIKWPKTNSIVFSCFMLQKWLSVVNCKKSKEVNIRYNVIICYTCSKCFKFHVRVYVNHFNAAIWCFERAWKFLFI